MMHFLITGPWHVDVSFHLLLPLTRSTSMSLSELISLGPSSQSSQATLLATVLSVFNALMPLVCCALCRQPSGNAQP